MKKTILAVLAMVMIASTAMAQVTMRIELEDGNHVDYPVSSVKSVSWVTNDNTIDNAPDNVQAVDLGLSVKWASMNVGATTPEDYGEYIAWGETKSKSYYSSDTYFDSVNGSSSNFNKYSTSMKTTLDPEDDAAHVNWGGAWRMPTIDEQVELRNNCTWTWTTQNGVYGYKVSSKTNSNFIFLPAAGCRDNGSLFYAGSNGYYWSSSLCTSGSGFACCLYFGSNFVDLGYVGRYDGRSVRAVCP